MKLSSGEKKLFVFCALVTALPLGVGLFLNRINATPVVSIPAPAPRPKPNGHDLYVAAAMAMTRGKPEVDPVSDRQILTDPKVRAQRYSLTRRTVWLDANKKAFTLFDQAQKTPAMAPPVRSFKTTFPGYAKVRQLARDKSAQSNTLWMRGDTNGAFNINLDTIQMGHDIQRGGHFLEQLVGIAIRAIGRGNTGGTLEHLNAAQCESAARRIEKLLVNRWRLDQALTEDKWQMQAGLMERFETSWRPDFFGMKKASLFQRLRARTISKQQLIDNIGAIYDHEIANARLPYAKKRAPLQTSDPFTEILVPVLNRAHINEARGLMGDYTLMLQLSLRAYKLENGAYPPNLKPLVPNYLNAVPADPFGGGESLRYKLDGKSYKLWSIGPDGIDNGGKPIPPRAGSRSAQNFPGERPRGPRSFTDFNGKGDVVAGVNN